MRNFIAKAELWPNWPILPMKRWGPRPEHGVLLAASDETRYPGEKIIPVIVMVDLFAIPHGMSVDEIYARFPKKEFASMDALLADGWIVD